jgi:cobalamin biosynthesis Mg chelatase CobN
MRWAVAGLLLAAVSLTWFYLFRRPRVVFLGFPDMYRFALADASAATGVRYDYWRAAQIDDPNLERADFRRYSVIYVSARRSDPLPAPVREALAEAEAAGSRVMVIPPYHTARLGVGAPPSSKQEHWIEDYWRYGGPRNMERFLQATAALYLGSGLAVEPPVPTPDDGYYHPDAPDVFPTTQAYLDWHKASGHFHDSAPKVLIDFADGWKLGMTRATDALIRAFETSVGNVAGLFCCDLI